MKITLLFLSFFLSLSLFGQNVMIPDANFKAYLLGNSLINTNGDAEIQFSEANAFEGSISCNDIGISDLTGIEAFTTLNILICSGNQLTSLDVKQNTALTLLHCSDNQLITLDVSYNPNLTYLFCFDNQLTCLNLTNGYNSEFNNMWADGNPNLTCIEVDDINYATANWTEIDPQTSFSENCNNDCSAATATTTELTSSKNLIQILDLMGRETAFRPNTPLIYVYDDGSTEIVFTIE